jgi:hypothetical protein
MTLFFLLKGMTCIVRTKNSDRVVLCSSPVFENWVCHAERLGLKYLVWADDDEAATRISAFLKTGDHGKHGTLFSSPAMTEKLGVTAGEANWRNRKAFNIISTYKLMVVRMILDTGANVWFSDADIAFVQDPWPRFRLQQSCDYIFQNADYGMEFAESEANTGFHLFRSNSRMVSLLHQGLNLAEKHPDQSDQWALWEALLRTDHVTVPPNGDLAPVGKICAEFENYARICPLPYATFPVGRFPDKVDLGIVVILHANWVIGRQKKYEMLKKWGVWALNEDYSSDHFGQCTPESSLPSFAYRKPKVTPVACPQPKIKVGMPPSKNSEGTKVSKKFDSIGLISDEAAALKIAVSRATGVYADPNSPGAWENGDLEAKNTVLMLSLNGAYLKCKSMLVC